MDHSISLKSRIVSCVILLAFAVFFAADALATPEFVTTTVVNVNSPPVAENLIIETYRDVSVTESFKSVDPEGDIVSYAVSVQPKKGVVDIDGDTFTYTPGEGKKGKDTFSYVAVDAVGNISEEAIVTVRIKKQSTQVTYSDMDGHASQYSATALAEKGLFVGEQIGSEYFFCPTETFTRGEFLVMCMKLCGHETTSGITRTGFSDDADIPLWQKPYIASALLSDIISGRKDDSGKIVFSSDDAISTAEAAVILNNAIGITDVSSVAFMDSACPVWASQAVMNLSSCGIRSSGEYSAPLTRAAAAELLMGACEILDARN